MWHGFLTRACDVGTKETWQSKVPIALAPPARVENRCHWKSQQAPSRTLRIGSHSFFHLPIARLASVHSAARLRPLSRRPHASGPFLARTDAVRILGT